MKCGSLNIFLSDKKDARIETKLSSRLKELLQLAASLQGSDLTSFILSTATEKAREIIDKSSNIYLDEADSKRLFEYLNAPPAPTAALKALMADGGLNGERARILHMQ